MRVLPFAFAATLAISAARGEDPKELKDVVDTAIADKELSTLVTAVKAAGLVETLKEKGPYTVFAPTDAAFEKVGKEKLEALLADKTKLKRCCWRTLSSARRSWPKTWRRWTAKR